MGFLNWVFRFSRKTENLKSPDFRFLKVFHLLCNSFNKNDIQNMNSDLWRLHGRKSLLTGLVFTFRCACGT